MKKIHVIYWIEKIVLFFIILLHSASFLFLILFQFIFFKFNQMELIILNLISKALLLWFICLLVRDWKKLTIDAVKRQLHYLTKIMERTKEW